MKIHEYQAKELFAQVGIPVPPGKMVTSATEAFEVAQEYNRPVMVKSQVHVGGRGKAGGIKYAETANDAKILAKQILGMEIKGLKVNKLLITAAEDIITESYVGIVLDRDSKSPVIMVSPEGGIDIEEVAAKKPEKIFKLTVDPVVGLLPYQARNLAYKLYRELGQVRKAAEIITKVYDLFWAKDCSLVEINPLITNTAGEVIALDAKINIDDNGLFRHSEIGDLRDIESEDPGEVEARDGGLSFIRLDGNIGCIVNGAGLAMTTMDLVKRYGGEPANFLDIGGSSNPQKVVTAIKIILDDPKVEAILINIFGGITRCDDVANGIVAAFKELNPSVPVVVRLTGTNEAKAKNILKSVNLPHGDTLDDVVKKTIERAQAV